MSWHCGNPPSWLWGPCETPPGAPWPRSEVTGREERSRLFLQSFPTDALGGKGTRAGCVPGLHVRDPCSWSTWLRIGSQVSLSEELWVVLWASPYHARPQWGASCCHVRSLGNSEPTSRGGWLHFQTEQAFEGALL